MPTWDPHLYLRFAAEREQPALDLAARVPLQAPATIVDLGCGAGNVTARLATRWPQASLIGVDSSEAMIATARERFPGRRWEVADLRAWQPPAPVDLLFANAVLQWVPDHEALLPRLLGWLAPGGVLAVQMPAHPASPVHELAAALADEPAWHARLAEAGRALWVGTPAFYLDLLGPRTAQLDVWLTEYQHLLEGPDALIAWVSGTGLRPLLEALPDEGERERFSARLRQAIEDTFERRPDGRLLLPYRRLFVLARV